MPKVRAPRGVLWLCSQLLQERRLPCSSAVLCVVFLLQIFVFAAHLSLLRTPSSATARAAEGQPWASQPSPPAGIASPRVDSSELERRAQRSRFADTPSPELHAEPPAEDAEPEDAESEPPPSPPPPPPPLEEALPSALSGNATCESDHVRLTKVRGYWTYEVCLGQYVVQYHQYGHSRTAPPRLVTWLGRHDADMDEPRKQRYRHGDPCQPAAAANRVPRQPREVEVRWTCGGRDRIVSIDEPSKCQYAVVLELTSACTELR